MKNNFDIQRTNKLRRYYEVWKYVWIRVRSLRERPIIIRGLLRIMQTKQTKYKIFSPLQLPPPVHGSNIINELVAYNKTINSKFQMDIIPISYFETSEDIGKMSFKKIFLLVKYILIIISKIKNKYDLIYFVPAVTGIAFYRDFILLMVLKLFNTKILIHLHGKGIDDRAKYRRVDKALYKTFFKNTKVICLSELLKYDIENIYNGKPFIVNNCVKDKKLPQKTKNNTVPVITFLSNLIETKGILVLIEAANILKEKGVDFKLNLIGSPIGNITYIIDELIEQYCLKGNILALGPKYGNEKDSVLINSDIFVFPTYYPKECFPLVILEAMQAGLPIITTDEGAILDMVDNNKSGLIVHKKDPADLAAKIKLLIEDTELREKMGYNGKKRYEAKYKCEVFEKRMYEVFNQAISDSYIAP